MLSYDFKRSLYSATGLVDFGTRLITSVGETISGNPNGVLVTDTLQTTIDNLVIANEREKSNPITVRIHEMDEARTNNLRMIGYTIRANVHNEQDNILREAANSLLPIYTQHGVNVTAMGNTDESSAIRYLIEQLLDGDNKPKREQLGIIPVIEALGKSQDDLDELYAECTRITARMRKITILAAAREAANAIRSFLGFVDVMVATLGDDGVELHDQTMQIIREVEALARSRKNRAGEDEIKQPKVPLEKAA